MAGNITLEEHIQIENAVSQQMNKVIHKAIIQEQQKMLQEGYPLPEQQEMPFYVAELREEILTTIIKSN